MFILLPGVFMACVIAERCNLQLPFFKSIFTDYFSLLLPSSLN